MPSAKITSIESIERFRNNLIIYLSKAKPTLEEINSDVMRLRTWIEHDQRLHWEHEARRRKKNLDEAQNAFFSAQMSKLRQPTVAERMAVTKARTAFDEAETKLRIIKKWNRELSSQVEPLGRQLEHLHTVLTGELPKALAYLNKAMETLQSYSAAQTSQVEAATSPTPDTKKENNELQ